jgi:hypothetical protein
MGPSNWVLLCSREELGRGRRLNCLPVHTYLTLKLFAPFPGDMNQFGRPGASLEITRPAGDQTRNQGRYCSGRAAASTPRTAPGRTPPLELGRGRRLNCLPVHTYLTLKLFAPFPGDMNLAGNNTSSRRSNAQSRSVLLWAGCGIYAQNRCDSYTKPA